MKTGKKVVVVGGVLVLVLVVAGLIATIFIDAIAKAGIEKGGTYAMGVPTTLDSADIGLFSGKFAMVGLTIANPPGFKGQRFFALRSGGVEANLGSLTKDVVEVPSLNLEGIRVSLERSGSGSNYQTILDNLKKFESKDPAATPKESGEGKKFIIRQVVIRDVEVSIDMLGTGPITIPIHEIKLNNVGSAEGGLTAGQLSSVVVKAVLATAVERGGGIIPSDIAGELKGGLAQLQGLGEFGVEVVGKAGESAQKLAEGLTQMGAEAGEAIKKGAEGVLKGIGDLIPGKK